MNDANEESERAAGGPPARSDADDSLAAEGDRPGRDDEDVAARPDEGARGGDDVAALPDEGTREGDGAGGDDEGAAKGVAAATEDDAGFRAGAQKPGAPAPRKLLRTIYWALWCVVVPATLACVLVWALTPPSGVEESGVLGFVEGLVRAQPVPAGIVFFLALVTALWAVRHHLPLAYHAHPPLRSDLPRGMRGPFERARALLEEADAILESHGAAIKRELGDKERDALRASLSALAASMEAATFDEDAFVDALVKADGEVDVRLGRWRKSEVREYAESIAVAIAAALAIRAFVVEAFKIPSGSMIPTLQVGDHIFVNKFTYGPSIPQTQTRLWSRMPPERGDVIVFAFPENMDTDFIKRVIAVPGDKLEVRGGHPIINGWTVPSCYVGAYSYVEGQDGMRHEGEVFVEFLEDEAFLTNYDRQGSTLEHQGPYYVKPGEVWVMGDNRHNSHDSRAWRQGEGGGVPFANIKGRALFVWLSIADGIDASRIFAPVMGRPPGKGPFGALPPAMASLEPAIQRCLRDERPPTEATRPPPGEQVVR